MVVEEEERKRGTGKNSARLNPRTSTREIDDILSNFLDGNPNPDWKQFENWFGRETLDMVKELYPEYFYDEDSSASDAGEDEQQKNKGGGGGCSNGAQKDDQSSDQLDENTQPDQDEPQEENQEEQNPDEQNPDDDQESDDEQENPEESEEQEEKQEEEENNPDSNQTNGKDDENYQDEDGVGPETVDESVNQLINDKTYTVFSAEPPDYEGCPVAYRDNVSDHFTPQDDLMTMEKTVRDFLRLEEKIYDPESTNPRFFASETWVHQFEKDKNVVLALHDQYKANIIKMEHLYTQVDDRSYENMISIPNQECKSSFETNIMWTSRALKDWGNNWFISGNSDSSTPLYDGDHWLPGLTGEMVSWMKLGSYREFDLRPIATQTTIRKIDQLEERIDRLINQEAVQNAIAKYINLKEALEQTADQKEDRTFTVKVIDSQMGQALGTTSTTTTNEKVEGTKYIAPKEDEVENIKLVLKKSNVKEMFQTLREQALEKLKEVKCAANSDADQYPKIWQNIDVLAKPVYNDLCILNELIEDKFKDSENPGKHCSITHEKLDPTQLKKRIKSFKSIIQQGVTDVMINQAQLPQKAINILDSMFNQLWEYGERGPKIELPSWCQDAIQSIDHFERTMMDAWNEVYDCWEREFITRLWRISVDHHTSNYERTQTKYVRTFHNHIHPIAPLAMVTLPSIGGDTVNYDLSPLKGILTCPGHIELLMKPVCVHYRIYNIDHLARHYRPNIKALCNWMVCAIEAIGIKLVTISAVQSDPTLNGNDANMENLKQISDLMQKNHEIRTKIEDAYCIYRDVENMKNKKEWDEQIALAELQPNKYSNEDQLNMTSSIQSETNQSGLDSNVSQGGIDINELKPWNHISSGSETQNIPLKGECNPLDKILQTLENFKSGMNLESNQNTGDSSETTGVGKEAGGIVGSHVGGYVGEYAGAAVGGYFGGPIGAAVGGYVGQAAGSYVGEQIGEQVGEKAEATVNEKLNDDDKNYSDKDKTYNQDNDYIKYYDYYKARSTIASMV